MSACLNFLANKKRVRGFTKILNGNVKFYPFTYILNITINCFRMFESGSNLIGLHIEKVEF
jgi:hypothetical protein